MASFLRKVVLITGASSGIGASTAVEFAKKGASLALVARRKDALQEVADQCMVEGLSKNKILIVSSDLAKEGDINQCFHDTVNKYGTIDTLVNNAGYGVLGSIEDLELKALDDMYQIHTRAVFQLSKLVIPYLKTSQGSIVNVSSFLTQRVFSGTLAYSIGKAAMEQITNHFASDLAKDNVRVNSVAPGFVRTNIQKTSGLASTQEEIDQFDDQLARLVPIGRCGLPDEVAKAIVYLASDDAKFITGTNLVLDGGQMIAGLDEKTNKLTMDYI